MLLWVCNLVSRRSKNGNVSIYMANMEKISDYFEMT